MQHSLYQKYGLKKVINASGRMTKLGVSTPSDTVLEAVKLGAQNYIEMADLVEKAGKHVASLLGTESAIVVNSASSGIVLAVAGMVTKGKRRLAERLHQEKIVDNEIVIFKGHNVQYGAPIESMISLGAGKIIEAGYANEGTAQQLKEAITEHTAAILYVKSHHAVQKNIISLDEAWGVARANNIPFIVDAAAEEDFIKYAKVTDIAIYSGSKALQGPTSGIVAGKEMYINWIKTQTDFIGRSMKVGKESVFGLIQALDEYVINKDVKANTEAPLTKLKSLISITGVNVEIIRDEAGRDIERARIYIDPSTGTTAKKVDDQLRNGDIAIYTRNHNVNLGFFDIDPRPLREDDIDIIKLRLETILSSGDNDD